MSTPTAFDDALHPRGQAANAGQFRAKANAAPAGELTAPAGSRFGTVTATVTLKEEGILDDLVELDRSHVDIGTVLDALHVDDLPAHSHDFERLDGLFRHARSMGLIGDHDGPFELDVTDAELDGYRDARTAAHKYQPLTLMPLITEEERRSAVRATLRDALPTGGLKAALAWDEDAAAAWAVDAQKTIVLSLRDRKVQHELLDPADTRILAGIREAAIVRHDGQDAYRARTAILAAYEHLASGI